MRKFDIIKHYFFIFFITLSFLVSCTSAKYRLTKERTKNIPITESIFQKTNIENFITPYRERIKAEMSTVLAENARDLVKDRKTTQELAILWLMLPLKWYPRHTKSAQVRRLIL